MVRKQIQEMDDVMMMSRTLHGIVAFHFEAHALSIVKNMKDFYSELDNIIESSLSLCE